MFVWLMVYVQSLYGYTNNKSIILVLVLLDFLLKVNQFTHNLYYKQTI